LSTHPVTVDLELAPEDNLRLANLCGQLDGHLRLIERRLGVEIGNRGVSFRIIGERDAAAACERLLRGPLRHRRRRDPDPGGVHLHLQQAGIDALLDRCGAAAGGGHQDQARPDPRPRPEPAGLPARHPAPRHQLRRRPAGTGKTYLAVACAVEALETERVRRLLLVRPAVEAGERLGFLPGDLARRSTPICARSTTPCSRCSGSRRSTSSSSATSSRSRRWPTCAGAR
jgi:phosphate starvation-inducible PhoH-like protein